MKPSLALAVALAVFACKEVRTQEESRSIGAPHVSASLLRVESANGAITVKREVRSDVHISATLRANSLERLHESQIVAERSGNGDLSIHVAWAEGKRRNNEGCDFEVLIPDVHGVDLLTANGALKIEGLAGKAELRSNNGRIEVQDHDGSLMATTSNGRVVAAGVTGPIEIHTRNGKIDVSDAPNSVKARTSNGAVSIGLTSESPGPVEVQTSNGAVSLNIGPAFSGELDLSTSNGSLDVEDLPPARLISSGKNHIRLAFGHSEHESTVSTSNGSISVRGVP